MDADAPPTTPIDSDTPRRVRAPEVASRYGIAERTAGEWLRRMIAVGTCRRVGAIIVGKWREMDAWVAAGGQRPDDVPRWRRRDRSAP